MFFTPLSWVRRPACTGVILAPLLVEDLADLAARVHVGTITPCGGR